MVPGCCKFSLVVLGSLVSAIHGFYHQPTFLEAVFDEFGNEVSGDWVLELADMKSTSLGYGLGLNYSKINYTPFNPPIIPPYILRETFPGLTMFDQHQPSRNGYGPRFRMQSSAYAGGTRGRPASSYRPAQSHDPVAAMFAPMAHRRFKRKANKRTKRQAGFPSDITGDSLLDQLPTSPFGRQPDLGPTSGLFLGDPFPSPGSSFPASNRQRPCPNEKPITCNPRSRYRTVDGLCNNLRNPKWGAAMQPQARMHKNYYYQDGLDVPRMTSAADARRLLPSARLVSRLIHEPDRDGHEIAELTNLVQQWGQFLDHDLTGTPTHKGPDGKDMKCCNNVFLSEERQIHNDAFNGGPCNPIYIPPLDRHFRHTCMNFARSLAYPTRRDCSSRARREPREQMNMLTSYIDASQVYGSKLKENQRIRLFRHGMLKVTSLDLLPEDVNSTCVKDSPSDYCFLAGEMRVNEHPALSSIHTVFHRLHNQLAMELTRLNTHWSDEKTFQETRKIMGAIMQHVTYSDWLPIILGDDIMRREGLAVSGASDNLFGRSGYWSYDDTVNPTILNEFAAAAFRFGHTLIPSSFTIGQEKVRLHHMFNRPTLVLRDGGESVGKFCAGLMEDSVQHFDRFLSTDLSDRLFEDKDNISMDLAALNIHRARDHGLPGYNEYRSVCGLPRIKNFEELYREDPDRAEVFRRVYEHVDDIDLFPGGVSERSLAGAVVGPTFACILARQFHNLKFGDRYWYESRESGLGFTHDQLRQLQAFSLSKAICTMAHLRKIVVNPFYANGAFLPKPVRLVTGEVITQNRYVDCGLLHQIDLRYWRNA